MEGNRSHTGSPPALQRTFASSRLGPELMAVAYELLVPGEAPTRVPAELSQHGSSRPRSFRSQQPIQHEGGHG
jgi:hypothetical protein